MPPANAPRRAGRGREFSGGVSVRSGEAVPVEAPAAIQAFHGGHETTCIAARGRRAGHPNGIRRGARRLAGLSPGPKSYIIRRPRPYPPSLRAASTARKSAANVLGQPLRIPSAVRRARSDTVVRRGGAPPGVGIWTGRPTEAEGASPASGACGPGGGGRRASAGTGSATPAAWRRRRAR